MDSGVLIASVDGEQVDSKSGSLSSGQSTSVTLTYLTEDGNAGDRCATASSDDDSDSTTVTVEGTTGDDSDEEGNSNTDSGLPSPSPSDGDDALKNITVSSASPEVPIDSTVTGLVTTEKPHGENAPVGVTIGVSGMAVKSSR